jgi:hypothetical protein
MNDFASRLANRVQLTSDGHRAPAMAAGVSDHVWELEEIAALMEAAS